MQAVKVGQFECGKRGELLIIAGPCVLETRDLAFEIAETLKEACDRDGLSLVFKASFDKANRTSAVAYRGLGMEEGLRILEEVSREFSVPTVTDIHLPEQAAPVSEVVGLLQIPAFLARQTDLLVAAGKTGKPVNVKKGQFMAPWDMLNVVEKLRSTGNENIILVDRGASFGYNNLVSDMRAIPIMQGFGVPVCFDSTHSVQLPGGLGDKSGGQREFIETLSRSAVAAGANCLFMEAHPHPDAAKSDAASQVSLDLLPDVLDVILRIYEAVNGHEN